MNKILIMDGTEKRLGIGGLCPPYIYWKISVGRASVPARTLGGQGRPPQQRYLSMAWVNSIDFKL